MLRPLGFVSSFLFVVLPCASMFGQQATAGMIEAKPAAVQPAADPYPNEPVVMEKAWTVYRYAADGSSVKEFSSIVRLQSEAAVRQFGVVSFVYTADSEKVEVSYVRVRKPDGTVVNTPLEDAQDIPAEVTRQAPMYSDIRVKQIPIRSLSVGDRVEYEGKIRSTKPQAEGNFWAAENFATGVVALDELVEVHVPRLQWLQVWDRKGKVEITESGNERIYGWKATQLEPTVMAAGREEKAKPKAKAGEPAQGPEMQWTTFKDWAAVGDWYRALARDRAAVTPEIEAKAKELTEGAKTDDEKLQKIYAYVATQIRYIGVDFGVGRYQPHSAAEVLRNQYGDCKDKGTLLQGLLQAAGFESSPALIGAGIKANPVLATPQAFNHLISVVAVGKERVWLDTTSEVAPYRMLNGVLRDKPALVIPATGAATLERTPAALPFAATDKYECHGTLDKDGVLKAHFDVSMRGDFELWIRQGLHQTTRGQWDEVGQSISRVMGFGGEVSHFEADKPERTAEPLHLTYEYEKKDFADWQHHRTLGLIPYGLFSLPSAEDKPTEPIDLGSPRVETARSVMHLPPGYGVKVPAAAHTTSSFADLDTKYEFKDGDLIEEQTLRVKAAAVPVEQWEKYKEFLKWTVDQGDQFVDLTTGDDAKKAEAPPLAVSRVNNIEAQELVEKAYEAVSTHDLNLARESLKQAEKINPEQARLWSTYGYLAYQERRFTDAILLYRKELELYPDALGVYESLADAQLNLRQKKEAIETLQTYVKLQGEDDRLRLQLGVLLIGEKRYPEAISMLQETTLREAEQSSKFKDAIVSELKAAQLMSVVQEGGDKLQSAIDAVTDPMLLNNVAYEMANQGKDLPLAERTCKKALELLELETHKVRLENVTMPDLGKVNLLVAAWDTMGWIDYQENHDAEAESFLAAAWKSAQRPEIGYHLGKVYERQGKKQAALDVYQLALATLRPGETPPDLEYLQSRRSALVAENVRPRYSNPGEELGKERMFVLPLLADKPISAEFYVVLSPSNVKNVAFITGNDKLASAADRIQTAKISVPFPEGSKAEMVRRGVLFCSPMLHQCEFTLMLPQDTNNK